MKALASHSQLGSILPADGGDCEEVLTQFAEAGIDVDALAAQLQEEGAKSFVKSWNDLMDVIASKSRRAPESQLDAGCLAKGAMRHANTVAEQTARHLRRPERPAWKKLESHYQETSKLHLRDLFAEDPKRGERSRSRLGLYLDYSKNRITDETLNLCFN